MSTAASVEPVTPGPKKEVEPPYWLLPARIAKWKGVDRTQDKGVLAELEKNGREALNQLSLNASGKLWWVDVKTLMTSLPEGHRDAALQYLDDLGYIERRPVEHPMKEEQVRITAQGLRHILGGDSHAY